MTITMDTASNDRTCFKKTSEGTVELICPTVELEYNTKSFEFFNYS